MENLHRVAGVVALAVIGTASVVTSQEPAEVVIRRVAVVDAVAGRLRPDLDIVVRGTRIVQVAPAGASLPPAKTTIDGRGKFAIAGLIDGDVRTATWSPPAAQALLAWGITAIGDRRGDPARLERWRQDLATGRRYSPKVAESCSRGAGLAAGSAPGAPDALHTALARQVASGRSPVQAILAFTRDNARALCLDDVGDIAPGHQADLVVLTANPIENITHTRTIDAVVFRGEVLTHAHLQLLRRGALPAPTPAGH
jgi:adenine deaminase